MRTAYDSVTVSALPTGGDLYLAYVDGRYANAAAVKARFPHKPVVRITVTGSTLDAEMADVETGDLTPRSGAAWAKRKLARGDFPVLYFAESSRGAIIAALSAIGVDPAKVGMFPADYDGAGVLNRKTDLGKQFRSPDGTGVARVTDGNYDASVVADYWPGLDPKPRVPALSPTSRRLVRRLTRRLARRQHPVDGTSRTRLAELRRQITRALRIGGK